jgi:putative ABC transport system permease protein
MRFSDLLGIALSALWQQKVRTLLTTAGVVIGTFSLVVSLSLGQGFEREVMRQLRRGDLSRQVMVWPGSGVRVDDIPSAQLHVSGPMSEAKRERIRQAIIHRWPHKRRGVQLDQERLERIAEIPHVRAVVPLIQRLCRVSMNGNGTQTVMCFAANSDGAHFRNRIVAGSFLPSDTGRTAVVSEYLLYRWGITDDDAVEDVVGKKLRLEYRPGLGLPRDLLALLQNTRLRLSPEQRRHLEKALREMPGARKPPDVFGLRGQIGGLLAAGPRGPLPSLAFLYLKPDELALSGEVYVQEFTIVGVIREFIEEQDFNDILDLGAGAKSIDADVFLPARAAGELFSRGVHRAALGFPAVIVTVDRERAVKEVARRVRRLGLHEYSLVDFVQGLRTNLILITFVTAFLAAVALLVAALGITNTMTMSVLERTREIGIMKAVGARDRHILFIFLVEGALIGLIGGSVGVLLGWLASYPGDAVAHALLQDQMLPTLKNTLFLFPSWLTLGAPLFAGLVTTLAALYPARRATRVNPITALRHE